MDLSCLWKLVKILFSVEWMKFSTLSCRPHHLNWMVTSLYAVITGSTVL